MLLPRLQLQLRRVGLLQQLQSWGVELVRQCAPERVRPPMACSALPFYPAPLQPKHHTTCTHASACCMDGLQAFLDAPHAASGPIPSDVQPHFTGPYFEWFTVEKNPVSVWPSIRGGRHVRNTMICTRACAHGVLGRNQDVGGLVTQLPVQLM